MATTSTLVSSFSYCPISMVTVILVTCMIWCFLFFQQVQGTNDNSTLSKVSTAQKGYFYDPFVKYFISKKAPGRAPLIHWGYWIRFTAVDLILKNFLLSVKGQKEPTTGQIVSLGAGFDTSYFRLKSGDQKDCLNYCHYYEVDYPTVITRKESIIQSTHSLQELVSIDDYTLIGCDITQLNNLEASLLSAGVTYDKPTLLLAEVVLTYISPDQVDKLLIWAAKFFPKAIFCVYEQCHPFDGFGQVMLKHFQTLSSPLMNIEKFPTTQTQCQRYMNAGWSEVYSCDMNKLYFSLPKDHSSRIMSLEPFDEYEEWHLKCFHYHLICALTSPHDWSLFNNSSLPLSPHNATTTITTTAVNKRDTCLINYDESSFNSLLLKRYGHASVLLKEDKQIVIYGGFGVRDCSQAHGRLDNLVLLKVNSFGLWETQEIISNSLPGPLMYHTMTALPSDKGILLIGGRMSPKQPNYTPYLLSYKAHHWTAIDYKGDKLEGRWRHSVTLINKTFVVIVGGCTANDCALDDITVCDIEEWIMKKLSFCLPEGRHSHLAVTYQSSALILGGLNKDLLPLSSCLQIKSEFGEWSITTIEFTPPLPAKYSMSGDQIENTLIAVGGVSIDNSPDVLIIDLDNKTWSGICLKYPIGVSIPLLCGQTSHILNGKVICVGGGGNCFSFGTHFNTIPFTFTPLDHN